MTMVFINKNECDKNNSSGSGSTCGRNSTTRNRITTTLKTLFGRQIILLLLLPSVCSGWSPTTRTSTSSSPSLVLPAASLRQSRDRHPANILTPASRAASIGDNRRRSSSSSRTRVSPPLYGAMEDNNTNTNTNNNDDDHVQEGSTTTTASSSSSSSTTESEQKKETTKKSRFFSERDISNFCQGTNEFWKGFVIEPVRKYVEIVPAPVSTTMEPATMTTAAVAAETPSQRLSTIVAKLIAPPAVPGLSRPVWFTILGSIPTALGWYGYYKFSVEEELYQYERQTHPQGYVSGCGGYGTLFPFVYGVLIGGPLVYLFDASRTTSLAVLADLGHLIIQGAGLWILAGQVNLYNRVNELCYYEANATLRQELLGSKNKQGGNQDNEDAEKGMEEELEQLEPPLYAWWALLPPPLDVVVGLRQVHFLAEYWRIVRHEPYQKDAIAEDLFPFISSKRFTLQEFVRTPSIWFWFTKTMPDFETIKIRQDSMK